MSAMFRINQIQGKIRLHGHDQNGNRKTLRGTGTHQQPNAKVDYTYAANRNRLATITRGGIVTSPAHLTEGELRLDFVSGYDSHGQRRWSGKRNGDTTQPEYYFAYNHKRERTVRSISNNGASWSANAIQYVYDEASHLIGEYTASGAPIVEYVWKGDVPIAAIYGPTSATKIYYIITDAQNTPRRLIDSSNNVVDWAWDSTAFGVAQPSVTKVNFNLRFPGQYHDPITKQHYNLNRYYNPEIGRYMEADPIGLEGGLNPYAYAGSNPVMNTDPSGLFLDPLSNLGMSDFTTGLNNFSSQLNDFIDRSNPFHYPASGPGITGYDLDGVPSFNPLDKAFHSYNVSSSCDKSSSCTSSLAWEGLQRYPFPNSNGSKIQDEEISGIPLIGSVRTEVYTSKQMIINVTLPSQHLLHPGIVMRYVSEDMNRVYINTHGEGTGAYPGLNNASAGILWGGVDSQIFEWMRNKK